MTGNPVALSWVRLCRYGSRGPLALERLSRREDEKHAYRTKRGVTLVLTAAQLVKRLLALVTSRRTALEVLARLGLDAAQGATPPSATAQRPPQRTLAL
jgi:hypothetical protein